MVAASAYILKVPPDRRSIILSGAEELSYFPKAAVAEPVPTFAHSRNAPLVVLASFQDDAISHIANGRKGASAGTGLVRLNMEELQTLRRPIPFAELKNTLPAKFRGHFQRTLDQGGLLPPKTLGAVVDALTRLDSGVGPRLARFSERRAEALRRLAPEARKNLALQKETLGVALEIAGLFGTRRCQQRAGTCHPQTGRAADDRPADPYPKSWRLAEMRDAAGNRGLHVHVNLCTGRPECVPCSRK